MFLISFIMSMDLTFLGTGSAYPSPHRGASAVVLRSEGECWLFDCGEGTQTQLMKSQLKAGKQRQPVYKIPDRLHEVKTTLLCPQMKHRPT